MNASPQISAARQFRYNYSASFASESGGVGGGDWLSLDELRRCVAGALRDRRYDPNSIRIVVQERKQRWVPSQHGLVSDIFPDLWRDWRQESAINEFLSTRCLALGDQPSSLTGRIIYRSEVDYQLKTYGLDGAIERAEQKLAAAEALVALLRGAKEHGLAASTAESILKSQ